MSRRTSRRVAALEEEPPARPKRGVPPPTAKDEMSDDQVAELWAQFAGDHYEIVEQLPLELHRNSRLLRELDAESLSQQTRLQARVREYVAYRIAVARPRKLEPEVTETEAEEPPDVKPRVSEAPEPPIEPPQETPKEVEPPQETPREVEPSQETPKETEPPQETLKEAPLDVPPTDTGDASSPAAHSPSADVPVVAESAAAAHVPSSNTAPVAPAVPPEQAAEHAAPASPPEEAEEHAAEAAVEAALAGEDPHTPRASTSTARSPAPYPKRVNLGEISSLISELVRNREEKVAIAVGAYNTIDRHIRALDSALSAQETSMLGFAPSAEPQPEPEPFAPKRRQGRPKRTSASASAPPTGLPPGIEADPNEPRYCYCNQVSYGEMVGCDNDDCPMEWFHLTCLGMTHPPAGEWMCDVCKAQKHGGSGGPPTAGGSHKKRRKR